MGGGDAALGARRTALCRLSPAAPAGAGHQHPRRALSRMPGGWEGNSEVGDAPTILIIITTHGSDRAAARPCACRCVPRAGDAQAGAGVAAARRGRKGRRCPSGRGPLPGQHWTLLPLAARLGSRSGQVKAGEIRKLINTILRLFSQTTLKDWGEEGNRATRVSCLGTSCESRSFTLHSHQCPSCPLPNSF